MAQDSAANGMGLGGQMGLGLNADLFIIATHLLKIDDLIFPA